MPIRYELCPTCKYNWRPYDCKECISCRGDRRFRYLGLAFIALALWVVTGAFGTY